MSVSPTLAKLSLDCVIMHMNCIHIQTSAKVVLKIDMEELGKQA